MQLLEDDKIRTSMKDGDWKGWIQIEIERNFSGMVLLLIVPIDNVAGRCC